MNGYHSSHRSFYQNLGIISKHMLLDVDSMSVIGQKYAGILYLIDKKFMEKKQIALVFGSRKCNDQFNARVAADNVKREEADLLKEAKEASERHVKAKETYKSVCRIRTRNSRINTLRT